MGTETVLFKSEEKKSSDDTANFLRVLADKIELGRVTLIQEDMEVILDIPSQVTLEVKAEKEEKQSDTKMTLEIEIDWYDGESTPRHGGLTLG